MADTTLKDVSIFDITISHPVLGAYRDAPKLEWSREVNAVAGLIYEALPQAERTCYDSNVSGDIYMSEYDCYENGVGIWGMCMLNDPDEAGFVGDWNEDDELYYIDTDAVIRHFRNCISIEAEVLANRRSGIEALVRRFRTQDPISIITQG